VHRVARKLLKEPQRQCVKAAAAHGSDKTASSAAADFCNKIRH